LILAGIDLERLDAQQMGNLIYALIVDESVEMGDKGKARGELDALLEGRNPAFQSPDRASWGLGPEAQAGVEAMIGTTP
jgi:hypothetical protein